MNTTIIILTIALTASIIANAVLVYILIGTRTKLRKNNRIHSYGRICGHDTDC